MSRIRVWSFGTNEYRDTLPVQLLPKETPTPPPAPIGGGVVTTTMDYPIGPLPADFQIEWASLASEWTVVADTTSPSGKVLRLTPSTADLRRAVSFRPAVDLPFQEQVKVLAMVKAASPASVRAVVRGSGTAATAQGYAAGIDSLTNRGITDYVAGDAINRLVPVSSVADAWYLIRLEALGPVVRFRVWLAGQAEPPTWDRELLGNRVELGWPGLFSFSGGAIRSFGHLSVATGDKEPVGPQLTAPTTRPVVDAGPNQVLVAGVGKSTVLTGTVQLAPGTTVAQHLWTLVSKPATSTAAFDTATGASRALAPLNVTGTYVARYAVSNDLGETSLPDDVTITVTSASTGPGGGGGTPQPGVRFGPNGTYWQPDTPRYDGADARYSIEVDCTPLAIKNALDDLTNVQIDEGVRLLVRPGTMPSIRYPAGIGSKTSRRRVLVRPRDGRSSVSWDCVSEGVSGVTYAGIWATDTFQIYGGVNVGWSRVFYIGNGLPKAYSRRDQGAMPGLYLGELYRPGHKLQSSDAADVWTFVNDIVSPTFEGWWVGPNYRKIGDLTHMDGIQWEPFDGGVTRDAKMNGLVVFGCDHAAMQINGIRGATLRHCYVVAQGYQRARYPVMAGASLLSSTRDGNAMNGGSSSKGFNHALKIYDSVVIGPQAGVATIIEVQRSVRRSSSPNGNGWTNIADLTDANYAESPTTPTRAYLSSIWGPE